MGLLWFVCCGFASAIVEPEDAFAPVQWSYVANAGVAFAVACAVLAVVGAVRTPLWVCAPLVGVLVWRGSTELDCWSPGEPVLERALALSPSGWQSWRLYHAMGVRAERQKNYVEADRCLRQAVAQHADERTLLFLGYVERAQKKSARARLLFETAARQQRIAQSSRLTVPDH